MHIYAPVLSSNLNSRNAQKQNLKLSTMKLSPDSPRLVYVSEVERFGIIH